VRQGGIQDTSQRYFYIARHEDIPSRVPNRPAAVISQVQCCLWVCQPFSDGCCFVTVKVAGNGWHSCGRDALVTPGVSNSRYLCSPNMSSDATAQRTHSLTHTPVHIYPCVCDANQLPPPIKPSCPQGPHRAVVHWVLQYSLCTACKSACRTCASTGSDHAHTKSIWTTQHT
jgi:hypothetical protein